MTETIINTAERPVGFFDSGFGGLTVLSEVSKKLPNENYIYFADTLNAPYGTKSVSMVKKLVFRAAHILAEEKIKLLVIACNTATGAAISDLRRMYDFPIIGMEPAVKPAVLESHGKRVLVAATPLTLKEKKFKDLLAKVDKNQIADLISFPELVEYAEKMNFDEAEILPYLETMFAAVDLNEYGSLVLGCTHYLYYRSMFKQLMPQGVKIIDSTEGTIKRIKSIISEKNIASGRKTGSIEYIVSGSKVEDTGKFQILMNRAEEESGGI